RSAEAGLFGGGARQQGFGPNTQELEELFSLDRFRLEFDLERKNGDSRWRRNLLRFPESCLHRGRGESVARPPRSGPRYIFKWWHWKPACRHPRRSSREPDGFQFPHDVSRRHRHAGFTNGAESIDTGTRRSKKPGFLGHEYRGG